MVPLYYVLLEDFKRNKIDLMVWYGKLIFV